MLLRSIVAAIDRQTAAIDRLEQTVRRAIGLPRPGTLFLLMRGEVMDMLIFDVVLPALPSGPTDIVGGRLTVESDGELVDVVSTARDQERVLGLRGAQDSQVRLSFVWIDDANNESAEPSVLEATLVDTFPPPNPGEMGIVVTGEEHQDEVEPEPDPEP